MTRGAASSSHGDAVIETLAPMVVLGLVAGVLTTVSGMGGGLVVIFVLSWVIGPKAALVVSASALLIGNVHRGWLYRADVDGAVVRLLLLGLVPGSLVGSLLVAGLPDAAIRAVMVLAALAALVRVIAGARWTLPMSSLPPLAALVGLFAATAGGAAVLMGPMLLAAGLSGRRYLAVVAVGAVAMHTTRLAGYGLAGLWDAAYLPMIAVLAAAILAGNVLGKKARDVVPARAGAALEVATPVVCAILAAAGLS
jgi:uncharacterized membrane protein YfcA